MQIPLPMLCCGSLALPSASSPLSSLTNLTQLEVLDLAPLTHPAKGKQSMEAIRALARITLLQVLVLCQNLYLKCILSIAYACGICMVIEVVYALL